ncbi:flagellar hook-associated protein FlgK [Butyrivibrio sp. M55]|uniref:flagellar hook-associated protein FlgK n=1 Tax=Butyrivibrio sp. M55 TaxID=1855323 RepID=UPI0008E62E0F|nr:flagellar hook-associated protein FlgK [Butyrivibrio sp. M55]SFU66402.1 flagellar hook-associated protein 1 FlgK [Butyrivibrio sp. M55]
MSLMANLYVGTSGLQTSQNALNTTAHNMANLDTEGYTRQQISQGTRAYQTLEKKNECISWKQIGTGVEYNNCKQVRDVFLDKAYRKESGRYAYYDISQKALEEIEDQFQEMNGTEFSESLNNLWTAVQELAKDPTSAVTQSALVTRANEFLTKAKSVYEGFVSYQDNLDSTVSDIVKNINDIGDQIKALNEEIVNIESGREEKANDLRDTRNFLLDKLGQYGKIDYSEDIFGNVSVLFEGSSFITTDHVNHIGIDVKLESSVGYATPYWEYAAVKEYDREGKEVVTSIEGAHLFDLTQTVSTATDTDIGKLKAVLLARGDHNATYHDITESSDFYKSNISQSVIMNVEAEFDQLIHNVMTAINKVMEDAESNPATMDNSLGRASDYTMFIVSNEEDALAYKIDDKHPAGSIKTGFTIKNAQVNPILLTDPTTFTYRTIEGNEDTATVTALKEAFTRSDYTLNPNVYTRNDIMSYYNSLISQVANTGDKLKSVAEAQEQTVSSISAAREQIVGVSSDEELEFMIQFQNAYNASSRYINVVSEMLEHLVSTLGS